MESIRSELGDIAEIQGAEAGMHLCAVFKGISDREVADRALAKGLWLIPLSRLYLGQAKCQGFIMGFGSTPADEIPDAIRRLSSCLLPAAK